MNTFEEIKDPDALQQFFDELLRYLCKDKTRFYSYQEATNNSERFHIGEMKSMIDARKLALIGAIKEDMPHYKLLDWVDVDMEYNRMSSSHRGEVITNPKQLKMSQEIKDAIEQRDKFIISYDNIQQEINNVLSDINNVTPDLLIHRRKDFSYFANILCIEGKVCTNRNKVDWIKDIIRLIIFSDYSSNDNYDGSKYGYENQIFIRICTYGNLECMRAYFLNIPNLSTEVYQDRNVITKHLDRLEDLFEKIFAKQH